MVLGQTNVADIQNLVTLALMKRETEVRYEKWSAKFLLPPHGLMLKVGQRLRGISTAIKYSFIPILLETLFLQLDCH